MPTALKTFQFTLQTPAGTFAPPPAVSPTCAWDGRIAAASRKQAVLLAKPRLEKVNKKLTGIQKKSRVHKIQGRDGQQHYVRRREFVGVFATLPFRCQEVPATDPPLKPAA